ncbi:MAG TPA: SUF system Fe-S cluster assembly regulator [Thermoanaerobaculia bacterium]|nr:SUF system Fe-S cluster assembly regulator [Thermoanaerobaculia bacterium]
MIRITRLTDYGIVLLSQMAMEPERRFNAPDLAAETRLPQPMVSKILKMLARSGLLLSHRGVHGGYSLARPAEQIDMAQIITALEGPIAVTECNEDLPGSCLQEASCPVRGNWLRINRAIRDALAEITLAEMSRPASLRLVSLGGRR